MISVRETAHTLARYGSICQDNGLVPIIEPEILTDGAHDINECARVSELVFRTVMQAMLDQGLIIEGTLLKPNMVTAGAQNPDQGSPEHPSEFSWGLCAQNPRQWGPCPRGPAFGMPANKVDRYIYIYIYTLELSSALRAPRSWISCDCDLPTIRPWS